MALLDDVMIFIKSELIAELRAQGHDNTGSLVNSMEVIVKALGEDVVGEIYMNSYWAQLEYGIKAANIPYTRGSGAGKSDYITGLMNYFISKGLGSIQAKQAAFATANVHKKYGYPSPNSYSSEFSSNNQRKGFMNRTIKKNMSYIKKYVALEYQKDFKQALDAMISRVQAA